MPAEFGGIRPPVGAGVTLVVSHWAIRLGSWLRRELTLQKCHDPLFLLFGSGRDSDPKERYVIPLMKLCYRFTPLALCVLLAAACGKKPEPEVPDAEEDVVVERNDMPQMDATSEIGGLNQSQVERVFRKASDDLANCMNEGSSRIEFLGGSISFYLLIDQSGSISHEHVKQSSLGDRETEKCMLDVLAKQTWPKPVGGKQGKAEYDNVRFDPPGDVRPPVDWDASEVEKGLRELSEDLDTCRQGTHGHFSVTMYVGTDGAPLGVGMATPGEEGGEAIDCLVNVLMSGTYPSPGSWPAKVSFSL